MRRMEGMMIIKEKFNREIHKLRGELELNVLAK